jgi:hypothetical protein
MLLTRMTGIIVPPAAASQAGMSGIGTGGIAEKKAAEAEIACTSMFRQGSMMRPKNEPAGKRSLDPPDTMAAVTRKVRGGDAARPAGRHTPKAQITAGSVAS